MRIDRAGIEKAIASAAEYILNRQSPCGQWQDFLLPPGPSDAWVTGYTGLALYSVQCALRSGYLHEALQKACEWSLLAMMPGFGWGYNCATGIDADSTAHMILFFSALHKPLPEECYNTLGSFQGDDGGFSTYRFDEVGNAWGISHPDVTPVAVNALIAAGKEKALNVEKAFRYIHAGQNRNGCWHSYWWKTFLYSTWVNTLLLEQSGVYHGRDQCRNRLLRHPIPDAPFELALYIGCLQAICKGMGKGSRRLRTALNLLLEMQLADGSWPAGPILRLTRDSLAAPWNHPDPGELFSDHQRIFTTATALRVLGNTICFIPNRK